MWHKCALSCRKVVIALIPILLSLSHLAIVQAVAERLPGTLAVAAFGGDTAEGHSIILQNCAYDAGKDQAGSPASGTAVLVVRLAGHWVPETPGVHFQGIIADRDGFVSGGGITLDEALATGSVSKLGGLGLQLASGSQVTFSAGTPGASIAGATQAFLPFRSPQGEQAVVNLPQATTISLRSGGYFQLNTKGTALSGPAGPNGLRLCCVTVIASAMDLDVVCNPSLAFTATFHSPTIFAPIPELLTQDNAPVALTAATATANESGAVNFTGATLKTSGQVVHLAKPLDFVLTLNNANVAMVNGAFTDFTIGNATLALPPYIKDKNGSRVEVPLAGLNMMAQARAIIGNLPELHWSSFGLSAPQAPQVDFSPGDNQGILIPTALLSLPPIFTDSSGRPFNLTATNFHIGSKGVSGQADLIGGAAAGAQLGTMNPEAGATSGGQSSTPTGAAGGGSGQVSAGGGAGGQGGETSVEGKNNQVNPSNAGANTQASGPSTEESSSSGGTSAAGSTQVSGTKAKMAGFDVEVTRASILFSANKVLSSDIAATLKNMPVLGVDAPLQVNLSSSGLFTASLSTSEPLKVTNFGGLTVTLTGAAFSFGSGGGAAASSSTGVAGATGGSSQVMGTNPGSSTQASGTGSGGSSEASGAGSGGSQVMGTNPGATTQASGTGAGGSSQTGGTSTEVPAAAQNNKATLVLNGMLELDKDEGLGRLLKLRDSVAIELKDLGITSDGNIQTPAGNLLNLPCPADLGLDVASIGLTQVEFGQGSGHHWMKFVGGVKLSPDLPMTPQVYFDGLKVYDDGRTEWGGIAVNAPVMGIGLVRGNIYRRSFTDLGYSAADYPEYKDQYALGGNVDLSLNLGQTAPIGTARFLVSNGCWYVLANVNTGSMPIGPGLALYRFQGGLGHNVAPSPRNPASAQPGMDNYMMLPNPGLSNYWAKAGVRIGTLDQFTFWGDADLTATYPPIVVDMSGRAAILALMKSTPDWSNMDRTGWMDLCFDGQTQSFRAQMAADLYFPTRAVSLIETHGNVDVALGPGDEHLFIGWPYDTNPFSIRIAKVLDLSGGVGIGILPNQFVGAGLTWKGNFAFLSGQLSGAANLGFDAGSAALTSASGQLAIEGNADLLVCTVYASGTLYVTYVPVRLDATGTIKGGVKVLGCRIEGSKSLTVRIDGNGVSFP